MQQRQVAAERRHRLVAGRRHPQGGGHEPVDPRQPPVGHEPQPLPGPGEGVHVPHRHARPHHQRPPGRHPAHQVAGHPPLERLRPLVQQPVDRLPGQPFRLQPLPSQGLEGTRGGRHPVGRAPGPGPSARRAAVAASRPEGSAVRRREAARAGSAQPPEGSTRTWGTDSSSQAVRALLVGAPPTRTTRLGPVGGGEPGRPEQAVVGGDRGRAAAGPGQRVGQHRPAAGGGERVDGGRVQVRPPAGDQQPPRVGPHRLGQAGHVAGGRRPHPGRRGRPRRAAGPARRRLPAQPRQRLGAAAAGERDQRVGEGQVEVDRPGRRAGRLGPGPAGQRPPVAAGPRVVAGHPDLAEPPHRRPVQLELVGRLVGPGPAQLGRPVRGQHQQRRPGPGRPPAPPGGSWPPPSPRCTAPPPPAPTAWPPPGRRTPPTARPGAHAP